MTTRYAQLAGQSIDRLAALSDGIFAVAMTLLVLDLRVPAIEAIHAETPLWSAGALDSEHALLGALLKLSPRLLTYSLSFLTLGIFWLGQQTQLQYTARADRGLTWRHLMFLFAVSLMPFSTSLLSEYITYRIVLASYWLNLFALGVCLYLTWSYASREKLLKDDATAEVRRAIETRITLYQAFYAVCVLVGIWNTYVSIAMLVMLQLSSALALRGPLSN